MVEKTEQDIAKRAAKSWMVRLIIGAACIVGLLLIWFCIFPPVQGYYGATVFEVLDGSSGYLHFHDGVVDSVNIGGRGGDKRRKAGTYLVSGNRVVISFFAPRTEVPAEEAVADLGLFRLEFKSDLGTGFSADSQMPRLWLPWIISRLNQVAPTPLSRGGAEDRRD